MNEILNACMVLISSIFVGVCVAIVAYYALDSMWIDSPEIIAVIVGVLVFGLSLPIFDNRFRDEV